MHSLPSSVTWLLPAYALAVLPISLAQFPPTTSDTNITTIKSPINNQITISYKSPPPGTCNTIFQTQKQYTGHVTIPPFTLAPIQQNYSINTFFWFFEARQRPETAPLTIWLNGGPGSSSMVGLFQENGPCEAIEVAEDQFGTRARPWGWDRSSNMLYIDVPNQVGFSYDTLTNGSLDLLTGFLTFPPSAAPTSQPPYTFLNGTFSSTNPLTTQNTSAITAQTTWHMLQAFLATFPQYNPGTRPDSEVISPTGVNLFSESYGGKYGPAFADFFDLQNARRLNGTISRNTTLEISLQSLGIISGCVDDLIQAPSYPLFANNNTYGLQTLDATLPPLMAANFTSPTGCQSAILACRSSVSRLDPSSVGASAEANSVCIAAQNECNRNVLSPFVASGRSVYDITHFNPDPFPPLTYLEYLNTAAFQSAIGTSLNYTETASAVAAAFQFTGDYERGGQLEQLSALLARGVRISLIHGDRDYICNWLGGQSLASALASTLPSSSAGPNSLLPDYTPYLTSAGHAAILINASYTGGTVRAFGNLSFIRVYDAGHLIPAYQPETAFTIFSRIIFGTNLATGEAINSSSFITRGDLNSTFRNAVGANPIADHDSGSSGVAPPHCVLRDAPHRCSERQLRMLRQGKGAIINGILYDKPSDWQQPIAHPLDSASTSQSPGSSSSATNSPSAPSESLSSASAPTPALPLATGVYVATGGARPAASKKASASSSAEVSLRPLLAVVALLSLLVCAT